MPVAHTSSGLSFEAGLEEPLLDAAQRAQVTLSYSCKTGRCNTCRSKQLSGVSRALRDEVGLTPEERADGWILTCVRAAVTDLELEIDDLGGVTLPPPRLLPSRIHTIDRVAPGMARITLRLPPNAAFTYLPGQYVDVLAHGVRRSYSIANAPRPDGMLELHVARVAGGIMSDYWFDRAAANDLVRINGPLGTFFLRNKPPQNAVLLATGSGLAPVKAMLEGLAATPEGVAPRRVYWGVRHTRDLYLDTSALPFAGQITPVLSRADSDWTGAVGYVQQVLVKDMGPRVDWSLLQVYACGSDAMIRDARALLTAHGLPQRNFHSDAFVCSA